MRSTLVGALVVSAGLGIAQIGAAQTAVRPTIHNVTLHENAGVLTITGIGFGREPVVTVDGQPVTVLPGGSETLLQVTAPSAVLTPGTYRLTVEDPTHQVGDTFVVAIQATMVAVGRGALSGTSTAASTSATVPGGPAGARPLVPDDRRSSNGAASMVIEDPGAPFRTAIGYQALFTTTGFYNTASGFNALRFNTTGTDNTASGAAVLYLNTTGSANTASGSAALYRNTTGGDNTATGTSTLVSNTTGSFNTASGTLALASNTSGSYNTAGGHLALYSNTSGHDNTASGYQALHGNTTGFYNVSSGYKALNSNTTGDRNTATGAAALYANTTGRLNTASGQGALYSNTTGAYNTAGGGEALFSNTTGGLNAGFGVNAGFNATTGSYNLFVGAEVRGTATDTNTIRIGLPYAAGAGQNQTFIAGIVGTALPASAVQVYIDANGQLGTVVPPPVPGVIFAASQDADTRETVDVLATIADLRRELAALRERLARLERARR